MISRIKYLIHIIKMLKKATDKKTLKEVDTYLTDFYERMGIIPNKTRNCDNCKHQRTEICPNSNLCYEIDTKPFFTRKGDK